MRNIGIDIDSELAYYRNLSTEDWTDRDYFETLTRTVFSGIKNGIIESRWNAISNAFSNFDFYKVAEYDDNKIRLLMENEAILRHMGKVKATVFNAKKMVEIVKQCGSFRNYLNSFSSIDDLVEKLQGYYDGFKGIGERNIYEFLKEIGIQTIKPDRQVHKVFLRLGLVGEKATLEEIIEIGMKIAKEVNERPCTIDWLLWRFGSEVCKSKNPLCEQCLLSSNLCFFNLSC
ncbi:MAG: DNA-3-methyladenine glycosylase I [Candidatus Bathyarchaeia archaeon]